VLILHLLAANEIADIYSSSTGLQETNDSWTMSFANSKPRPARILRDCRKYAQDDHEIMKTNLKTRGSHLP